MAGIPNLVQVADVFKGYSAHLIGDIGLDYATAEFSDVANTLKIIGDILDGSTSSNGEDISIEERKNEQGITVYTLPTSAGSIGWDYTVMSTDEVSMQKFLQAVKISGVTLPAWEATDGAKDILKFGVEAATFVAPFGLINSTKDRLILLPSATYTCALTVDGKDTMIKVSVKANKIDTPKLGTAMMKKLKMATAPITK